MGVTGSGKTTVGRLFAENVGWKYFDADDFHSAANIEKMKRGIALNDADRKSWLESLREVIRDCLERNEPAVLACSALKESYRRILLVDERVKLVYLKGDHDLIKQRLNKRRQHYMNPKLLDSQLQTLEQPADALSVDVSLPPCEIVRTIRECLGI
jgi:gluconokinase